jgi:hypothetical protein
MKSEQKFQEKTSYVYLMRSGDWYKVGVANNPEKRLGTLQTGNPIPINIIQYSGCIHWQQRDAFSAERRIHATASLKATARLGEWFLFSEQESIEDIFHAEFMPKELLGATHHG